MNHSCCVIARRKQNFCFHNSASVTSIRRIIKIRRHESCLVASENAMKISNYFRHRSEAERAASARALRSERKKKNGRKKRADPFLRRSSCARCMEKVVSMCKCAAEEFPHTKQRRSRSGWMETDARRFLHDAN